MSDNHRKPKKMILSDNEENTELEHSDEETEDYVSPVRIDYASLLNMPATSSASRVETIEEQLRKINLSKSKDVNSRCSKAECTLDRSEAEGKEWSTVEIERAQRKRFNVFSTDDCSEPKKLKLADEEKLERSVEETKEDSSPERSEQARLMTSLSSVRGEASGVQTSSEKSCLLKSEDSSKKEKPHSSKAKLILGRSSAKKVEWEEKKRLKVCYPDDHRKPKKIKLSSNEEKTEQADEESKDNSSPENVEVTNLLPGGTRAEATAVDKEKQTEKNLVDSEEKIEHSDEKSKNASSPGKTEHVCLLSSTPFPGTAAMADDNDKQNEKNISSNEKKIEHLTEESKDNSNYCNAVQTSVLPSPLSAGLGVSGVHTLSKKSKETSPSKSEDSRKDSKFWWQNLESPLIYAYYTNLCKDHHN